MTYSASNPPAGSYKLSVRNIEIVLVAQAKTKSGDWVDARLVLPNEEKYEIENIDGVLRKVASTSRHSSTLPAGSYAQTARNIRVLLFCEARKIDGSYVKSMIDVTDIKAPDIGNYDGVLLDKPDLDAAINQMANLIPEEAERIKKNREGIKKYMELGVAPVAKNEPNSSGSPKGSPATAVANNENGLLSPCATSCAVFAFDIFMTLLAYRGLRREQILIALKNTDNDLYRYLLRTSYQAPIVTLVEELEGDGSLYDKAVALAGAITSLMSPALMSGIVKAIYDSLSWWDATKMITAFLATTTALFAPGAQIALVAKCVLLVMSIEALGEDIYHVSKDCILS